MGRIQTPKAPTLVKRLASTGGAIRKLQVTGAVAPAAAGGGLTAVGSGAFVWGPTASFFSNPYGDKILIGDTFFPLFGDTSGIVAPGSSGSGTGTFQLSPALWGYQVQFSAVTMPDMSSFITSDKDLLVLKSVIRPDGSGTPASGSDTQVISAQIFNTGVGYGGPLPSSYLPVLSGLLVSTPGQDIAITLELVKIDGLTGVPSIVPLDGSPGSSSGFLILTNVANIAL